MSKKLFIIAGCVALIILGVTVVPKYKNAILGRPVACTMEAKLCPDGVTSVGRIGPNCEFSACPADSASGNALVRVTSPLTDAVITSPLLVQGEARGDWYFEASFPIHLFDGNGLEIAVVPARAEGAWMTTEFVPFAATLTFDIPATAAGTLVLERDNPSGLPQNDAQVSIPVRFTAGAASQGSGVRGSVTLGPTCPVERIPPDPTCAPKPYSTTIDITQHGTSVKTIQSDAAGAFRTELVPGSYTLTAKGGATLPRCNPVSVVVKPDLFALLQISCDTGIR